MGESLMGSFRRKWFLFMLSLHIWLSYNCRVLLPLLLRREDDRARAKELTLSLIYGKE